MKIIFECPVCGETHVVPDYYDNEDYICPNSANRVTPKVFNKMIPTDILSRANYPMNRHSTKVNERRAATVLVNGQPSFRRSGDRIGSLRTNY